MADYYYGPILLPEIPDRDTTRYPYVLITDQSVPTVYYSESPFLYISNGVSSTLESAVGAAVYYHELTTQNGKKVWGDVQKLPDHSEYLTGDLCKAWEVDGIELYRIWHSYPLYDKDGNAVKEASPAPRWKFPLVTWLTGLRMGTMEAPPTTVRRKESYDNEWPIQWSFPEAVSNYNIPIMGGEIYVQCEVKVSDIILSEEELRKLELDITENGVTSTYRYASHIAPLVLLKNDAGDSISLDIISEPTTILGITYEQSGIYCLYKYGDMTEKKFSLRMSEVIADV